MNKLKNVISLLLVIATLLGLMSGCSDLTSMMDSGAAQFAEGKPEEDYFLQGADQILDDLIDKYSGSYYRPTGGTMTDDEFDDAKKDLDDAKKDPTDPTDPSDPAGSTTINQVFQVDSYDSLVDAFHQAYDDTAPFLQYSCINGYTVDLAANIQDVYDAIQRVDPIDASGVERWQWYEADGVTTVRISYFYERDEFIRMKQETPALVREFADNLRDSSKSDYELICAVNKALCDTVVYPDQEPYAPVTHTAYGALKNGLAVCEGYACAALLVLEELGIDCDIQVGVCTNGGGHAWNLVYLEGNWYQMDVTWNDGGASITEYLLVTDSFMKRSRSWKDSNYPKTPNKPYKAP